MVQFHHLYEQEIYPLPLEDGFLVYAPLSGLMMPMASDEVKRLENHLATSSEDREAEELIAYINHERKGRRTIPAKHSPSEIHKLTILPTHRCNFRCSYCYSSEGRQNKTLTREKAIAMIDYFIDKHRTSLTDLWLAILGGGEPFLSPGLTAEIIVHARKRAKEQGFNLGIGLTTNGSLYDENLARVMVENAVSLGVSFEVLEEIQNQQRQHYGKVVETVAKYMDAGVDITIKSIITPANVFRLNEMVVEMHRLFPLVKKYKLQIVEDPDIFSERKTMEMFYADFTRYFFQAEATGRDLGIDVYVLASKYADMLIEHYCGGEMCLTPEGTITICHRKSSSKELGYEDFVYGKVDEDGTVHLDAARFSRLIAHDINAREACAQCFVKWHCGGGCLAQASIYNREQLDIICNWTRSFTKEILARRLQHALREDTGNL